MSTFQIQVLMEMTEMLTHYLESKTAKDQMFLVLYEPKRADLLYNLVVEKRFGLTTRLSILKLLCVLLQSPRVGARHKVQRMHLQVGFFLGKFPEIPENSRKTSKYWNL